MSFYLFHVNIYVSALPYLLKFKKKKIKDNKYLAAKIATTATIVLEIIYVYKFVYMLYKYICMNIHMHI